MTLASPDVVVLRDRLRRASEVRKSPKQQEGLRSTARQAFFRGWLRERELDAGFTWLEESAADAEASLADNEDQ